MRFLFSTLVLLVGTGVDAQVRFEKTPDGPRVVADLPADLAGKLPAGRLTQELGQAILPVSLVENKTAGPSMLGRYERAGALLTFTPRFPFNPGATYRAVLKVDGKSIPLDHQIPALEAKSPPRVVKIYPSADVLPANHLRFYIHFDRPMRGGKELFQHLAILDEKGKEIEEPWLVDEIWDEANHCLILFIHPGRIKWGVDLRQLFGPVLYPNRNYSLVVRGAWTDLEGNRIGKDVVKKFRTTAEDRVRIELTDWKLTAPKAGSRAPVALALPKSVDHRSLLTGLQVRDAAGNKVAGTVTVGPEEKHWTFTPQVPWRSAAYTVAVSPDLEDVAGNTPLRPFDVDLLTPKRPPQKLEFEFLAK